MEESDGPLPNSSAPIPPQASTYRDLRAFGESSQFNLGQSNGLYHNPTRITLHQSIFAGPPHDPGAVSGSSNRSKIWRRRHPWWCAAIFLLVVAGFAIGLFHRLKQPKSSSTSTSASGQSIQTVESTPGSSTLQVPSSNTAMSTTCVSLRWGATTSSSSPPSTTTSHRSEAGSGLTSASGSRLNLSISILKSSLSAASGPSSTIAPATTMSNHAPAVTTLKTSITSTSKSMRACGIGAHCPSPSPSPSSMQCHYTTSTCYYCTCSGNFTNCCHPYSCVSSTCVHLV